MRDVLYFARSQIVVFWRRYFLCDALFKTKDIVILRSSFKQRITRKRARQNPQFVTARSIFTLLGFCFAISNSSLAFANHSITKQNLQRHVEFLSAEALNGRLTGTQGEILATQYVADVFQHLGLIPAGDNGTFFQTFDFAAGVSIGKHNSLTITNQVSETTHLILNKDWRPLSFSDSISFESSESELVFAGYGITAPAMGHLPAYDSYRGLNVKNKWVIVFRYSPENITEEQNRQLSLYMSPRYKTFTAKDHGAKGIIFVSGPNAKVKDQLIPLSFDASLSGSGIAAISVKDSIITTLLKDKHALQTLQNKLDSGHQVSTHAPTHVIIKGQINIVQNKQHGRNVLAKLNVSEHASNMMIIGAHADHLGHGELSGSRENGKGLVHSGADDNASGVASVLESAIALCDLKTRGQLQGNKNILFAIWSGEELGLLGSAHFVKDFKEQAKNKSLHPVIDVDINLDMVGRLRENLVLQGVGSSAGWLQLIKQVNKKNTIPLITQNDPYLPTDSTSFYLNGVPTLNFFTGSHDEYHTARDKPKTLNYTGMKSISEFLVDMILALEANPAAMDYQQVKKTGGNTGRGFRVYFGTIPDYASADVSGVKLSGVTKGSPADRAGIKQNDVIIELAGKKIHDIYDYTFILSSLHVGKSVKMVVLRGKTPVSLMITGQSREQS